MTVERKKREEPRARSREIKEFDLRGIVTHPDNLPRAVEAHPEAPVPDYVTTVFRMQSDANHIATGGEDRPFGLEKEAYFTTVEAAVRAHDWGESLVGTSPDDMYVLARRKISTRNNVDGIASIFYVLDDRPWGMIADRRAVGSPEAADEAAFLEQEMPPYNSTERVRITGMRCGKLMPSGLAVPSPEQLDELSATRPDGGRRDEAAKEVLVSLYGLHKDSEVDQRRDGPLFKEPWTRLAGLYRKIYGRDMFILGYGSVETDFDITAIEVNGRSMELGNRQGAISRYLPPILSGRMWASTVAVVEPGTGIYPPKVNQFSVTGKEYAPGSSEYVRSSEADVLAARIGAQQRQARAMIHPVGAFGGGIKG